jgi:predicted esterase YcpF (UPF0227 family)
MAVIKPSMLLYIHGFNSSPLSHKAQVMTTFCQQHRSDIRIEVPRLPCFPRDAAFMLKSIVEQHKNDYHIGLVGSSLGGYLSTWLNSLYGYKAVLVNPAVRPYELLADYLGPQVNPYTDEEYLLSSQHINELRELDVIEIAQPDDFWLLQQQDDEVLDYRQAVAKYVGAKQTVEAGGDHSFIDFERYPSQIIQFLNL